MNLELRKYQTDCIDGLREGIRAGHKRQVLCAPTGAGKTVVATFLMQKATQKLSRSWFVVDRVALVDQTSKMFDDYKIDHGVIQASHWRFRPYERAQVISAQTMGKRGWGESKPQLLVVDEAHTVYKGVKDFITANPDLIVVGLSATPFTKGLGQVFTNVVNVTTTDKLIDDKFLVPVKPYAAKSVDMTGAKLKSTGEWEEREIEERGLTIIGDIVSEWIAKTTIHFGGPAKTIVFSATVPHGEELCRRFQEAGHNFQQVSYLDGNDDRRRILIEEFRKPDSEITGLVSCEALAKGFDVPDILCGISARPYRKSFSSHIQQIGRVMRPFPAKEYALWLDHSGNFLRFRADMEELFACGVSSLNDRGLDSKVRKEPDEEKEKLACPQCHFVMGGRPICPACGWERPKKQNTVEELDGELVEVSLRKTKAAQADALTALLADRQLVWRMICYESLERKRGDIDAAERFSKAQYRNLYDAWPRHSMRNIEPVPPHPLLRRKIQSMVIAWSKRRAVAA